MRILLVDDEPCIGKAIKRGLMQEKYAVDLAVDGTAGFDLGSTVDYDLIILDRMLPELDGVELCRKLRKLNIGTPILMLTAKGQTQDKVEGLDSGADDYLTKPFSFDELLARIRALSRRPIKTLPENLTVGKISLDTKIFTVKHRGKNVKLSKKEYSILEYLMRNPDKVLSKDQIIDHVWDFDADILPNTVEVNIRNLRRKLKKQFKNSTEVIKTIRGFGYKILK